MAILTHDEILKEIKNNRIIIDPFDESKIGPASIDFRLGQKFRIFRQANDILHVTDDTDHQKITKLITKKDFLTLLPGQSAQGITVERMELPDDICGWIQGRSKLARLGLMVHITSNFIQPGMKGRQVLEMTNAGPIPLAIHPGIAICQIILEETKGHATYEGKFKDQQTP